MQESMPKHETAHGAVAGSGAAAPGTAGTGQTGTAATGRAAAATSHGPSGHGPTPHGPSGHGPDPAGQRARAPRQGPSVVMALPALVIFGAFALLPLGGVAVLSFMQWDGLGSPHWAGLEKWAATLSDPATMHAMWLTVVYVIASYVFQAPAALLLGVFMAGRQRYRAVLSVLYFLPLIFSSAAVAITFQSLLDPNFGLARALHSDFFQRDWLGDPDIALFVVVFVVSWCFIPFHSLLYQAGVRQIPATMYEAATLDGAGRIKQFWYITLPQLRYTIVTSSTLMLVGSLTYFDLIYVLTGGGPGTSTRILPLHMYELGFRSYHMGQASAVACILAVVGLVMAVVLNRVSGAVKMESQQAGL